ncbi:hypothetical protein WISP_78991 [Willisornis vidua]|uniref:Uncharacterized protein n=1 Tax=Willisornis vidua TaxID=1566151 RepID=A0ABQ9DB42_9PASS|nr:hypothetical protein WISP_78991 [Willisornis vidua]
MFTSYLQADLMKAEAGEGAGQEENTDELAFLEAQLEKERKGGISNAEEGSSRSGLYSSLSNSAPSLMYFETCRRASKPVCAEAAGAQTDVVQKMVMDVAVYLGAAWSSPDKATVVIKGQQFKPGAMTEEEVMSLVRELPSKPLDGHHEKLTPVQAVHPGRLALLPQVQQPLVLYSFAIAENKA